MQQNVVLCNKFYIYKKHHNFDKFAYYYIKKQGIFVLVYFFAFLIAFFVSFACLSK